MQHTHTHIVRTQREGNKCVPAEPCWCKLWRTFESIFDDCLLLRNQDLAEREGCSSCVDVCLFIWGKGLLLLYFSPLLLCDCVFLYCEVSMETCLFMLFSHGALFSIIEIDSRLGALVQSQPTLTKSLYEIIEVFMKTKRKSNIY